MTAAAVALAGRGGRAVGGRWPCRPGPRLALADKNAALRHRQRQDRRPRYDLAVEAIKTFHTGVSEDFLLKEDQFKELRDRLLKSAADFYGKLGALLGKETRPARRGGRWCRRTSRWPT